MGFLSRLVAWFSPARWHVAAVVDAADEIPETLSKYAAVLVGSRARPKWLAFDCPCETGHRIMVPLDPRLRPHWRLVREKPLTVWPSIDYQSENKRCHYFVRRGRISWVED